MGACLSRPDATPLPPEDFVACVVRTCWCRDALYRLRHHALECHAARLESLVHETSALLETMESLPSARLFFRIADRDATIHRLERMLERQDRTRACCVCFHASSCVMYAPCHHVCVCERCDARVARKCPICRRDVAERTRVYFS